MNKKNSFPQPQMPREQSEPLLSLKEQMELLRMGDRDYIREFISTDAFEDGAENEFLRIADDGLLKFYISRHPLSEKAQMKLAAEKGDDIIAFYLRFHFLAKSAGEVLNRRYKKDVWQRFVNLFSAISSRKPAAAK